VKIKLVDWNQTPYIYIYIYVCVCVCVCVCIDVNCSNFQILSLKLEKRILDVPCIACDSPLSLEWVIEVSCISCAYPLSSEWVIEVSCITKTM
jgi:hypothetical protein